MASVWSGSRMSARARARAQASFDPPGLTVAVKRDRAAEALLLTGSKFVVNILAEGAEKARRCWLTAAPELAALQPPPSTAEGPPAPWLGCRVQWQAQQPRTRAECRGGHWRRCSPLTPRAGAQPVIKQLLRQFKPGEDRFAGLDVQARSRPRRLLGGAAAVRVPANEAASRPGGVAGPVPSLSGRAPHAVCATCLIYA